MSQKTVYKILVTGGTGFIGGRIVSALAQNGHTVILTSRQNDLHSEFKKLKNIFRINYNPVFDVKTPLPENIDCIIHLSAINEIDSEKDILLTAEVNTVHSLRLLEKAKMAGVKKFIYFSTAHVYGAPLIGDISESNLPRPLHPYAISHRSFEDYILAARDEKKIDGIVLRLSNAIGKPLFPEVNRWSLLVNELCKQSIEYNQISLKSHGLQQRDFIGITDVVGAVIFMLDLDRDHTKDGLFNLGGNCSMSVRQIAQIIQERTQHLFKNTPELNFPINNGEDLINKYDLNYSSSKLLSTGFIHSSCVVNEIDEMLIFCQKHFKSRI